jgi:antirestriction protein ArdC
MAMTTSDFHKHVGEQVIQAMQTAGNDWTKCWAPTGAGPFSLSTGRPYSGINMLILGLAKMFNNWPSNEFGTFKAWRAHGHPIKRGSKATYVAVYKSYSKTHIDVETGDEQVRNIRFAKAWPVFNAAQVKDYAPKIQDVEPIRDPLTAMDAVARDNNVDVRNVDLARAFYVPSQHYVNMPLAQQFDSMEAYACTLGHEMTHWTGHKSMLDRLDNTDYAFEELIAEIGAAMLAGSLNISPVPRDDHAQYLNNWIAKLSAEPKIIFTAAARAREAADFLMKVERVDV